MEAIIVIILLIVGSGFIFAFVVGLFTGENKFEGESYFSLGGMLGEGLHNLVKSIFQGVNNAVEERDRQQKIDEEYKKAVIEMNEREKNQRK